MMKQDLMTRRAFLVSASGAIVVISLPGCLTETMLGDTDRRALLRMARLLFPHDSLGDETYLDVLQPLLDRADTEPSFAAELEAGVEMLARNTSGRWLEASIEGQVESMGRIEEEAFFKLMLDAVRSRLYEHPTVWKLIGYEGPSAQFGGYLHRGFDDIDWLPEE